MIDLDFISDLLKIPSHEEKINIFNLSGFPHRETVASNIWAYFLNPDGKHKMGTMVLDSFYKTIKENYKLNGSDCKVSYTRSNPNNVQTIEFKNVKVNRERNTEDTTEKGKRIDIEIESDDKIIGIENKIDFTIKNNPMKIYLDQLKSDATRNQTIYIGWLSQKKLDPKDNKDYKPLVNASNSDPNIRLFCVMYDDVFDNINELIGEHKESVKNVV